MLVIISSNCTAEDPEDCSGSEGVRPFVTKESISLSPPCWQGDFSPELFQYKSMEGQQKFTQTLLTIDRFLPISRISKYYPTNSIKIVGQKKMHFTFELQNDIVGVVVLPEGCLRCNVEQTWERELLSRLHLPVGQSCVKIGERCLNVLCFL